MGDEEVRAGVFAEMLHNEHQGGADNELVRHRIQKGAEAGVLMELPGQEAVDEVGDAGQGEHGTGDIVGVQGAGVIEQETAQDKDRDQDDPEGREYVGNVHLRFPG